MRFYSPTVKTALLVAATFFITLLINTAALLTFVLGLCPLPTLGLAVPASALLALAVYLFIRRAPATLSVSPSSARPAHLTGQPKDKTTLQASFIDSAAHDLRAPLRGIEGFSSILEEDFAGALDDTGKDYLRRIKTECRRMKATIDGIRTCAKLMEQPLAPAELDLSAIAQEAAKKLAADMPGRTVEFSAQPGVKALGDPDMLRKVLENLLANSWKFTSETQHPRVEFGQETAGSDTVFYVRDNGAGFDMAYSGKLFEAFQRLHDPARFPGSGLGLYIVRNIIESHHGKVWAEGTEGKGATFYFTVGYRA